MIYLFHNTKSAYGKIRSKLKCLRQIISEGKNSHTIDFFTSDTFSAGDPAVDKSFDPVYGLGFVNAVSLDHDDISF